MAFLHHHHQETSCQPEQPMLSTQTATATEGYRLISGPIYIPKNCPVYILPEATSALEGSRTGEQSQHPPKPKRSQPRRPQRGPRYLPKPPSTPEGSPSPSTHAAPFAHASDKHVLNWIGDLPPPPELDVGSESCNMPEQTWSKRAGDDYVSPLRRKRDAAGAELETVGSPAKGTKSVASVATTIKGTAAYNDALKRNDIYQVIGPDPCQPKGGIPQRVLDLAKRLKTPFSKEEKEQHAFTHVQYALKWMWDMVTVYLPELDGDEPNEAAFLKMVEGALPLGRHTFNSGLKILRGHAARENKADSEIGEDDLESSPMEPEVVDLRWSFDRLWDPWHYAWFRAPLLLSQAKPDGALGYPHEWVQKIVSSALNEAGGDDAAREDIMDKVQKKCEICNYSLYFPFLVMEYKSMDKATAAKHQLRGAFAVAANAGLPWIGVDNIIAGLLCHPSKSELWLSWAEAPEGVDVETPRVHHYAYRIGHYDIQDRESASKLYMALFQIYMWGLTTRKGKLEAELKASVIKELHERRKRQAGLGVDTQLPSNTTVPVVPQTVASSTTPAGSPAQAGEPNSPGLPGNGGPASQVTPSALGTRVTRRQKRINYKE